MNILIEAVGFIGDVLFASSVAKKLKEKYPGCYIYFFTPVIQPKLLLEQNPYIDKVLTKEDVETIALPKFDLECRMPVVDPSYPATLQFQAAAGIEDQSVEYEVYTLPIFDIQAAMLRDDIKHQAGQDVKIVAWVKTWEWKAYQSTPETLRQGIGAPHRNIDNVISELKDHFIMLDIGFDRHVDTNTPIAQNAELYARTASLIKICDFVLGPEGGLTNLSAGLGVKTIITTDYIYQNYGPQGRVRRCDPPMMGPGVYFPNANHVHLDPCIKDEELAPEIVRIINE